MEVQAFYDSDDVAALKVVAKRLYDGDKLTYDERRDLAKQIDGIVSRIGPVDVKETVSTCMANGGCAGCNYGAADH